MNNVTRVQKYHLLLSKKYGIYFIFNKGKCQEVGGKGVDKKVYIKIMTKILLNTARFFDFYTIMYYDNINILHIERRTL